MTTPVRLFTFARLFRTCWFFGVGVGFDGPVPGCFLFCFGYWAIIIGRHHYADAAGGR